MTLSQATADDLCRRLEIAEGHLRAVRRMAEEGKDCAQLLLQLRAVRSAIDKVMALVVREHMQVCVRRAIESGDRGMALAELDSIAKYLVE